jgi:hypothetical protein
VRVGEPFNEESAGEQANATISIDMEVSEPIAFGIPWSSSELDMLVKTRGRSSKSVS